MNYQIREATPEDSSALHELITGVFSERLPVLFARSHFPSVEDVKKNIENCTSSFNSVLLIALSDNQVIGTLDFHGRDHPQQLHSGEFGMSVHRDYRGTGVGTKLLRTLIAWSPQHGVTRIELQVFASNPSAIRLYESLDFQHEGRRVGAAIVAGRPVDILLMSHSTSGPDGVETKESELSKN